MIFSQNSIQPKPRSDLALSLGVSESPPPTVSLMEKPIRFRVTDEFTKPLRDTSIAAFSRGYLFSNETHFDRFFDEVQKDEGGTIIGVAGLQNLELAVAAQASALILVDISPLQIPFLLSALEMVAHYDQRDFIEALQPLRRRLSLEGVLPTEIGERYGIAGPLMRLLQRQSPFSISASTFFDKILPNRDAPFWKDPAAYAFAQAMIRRGDVSVILGDFFGDETQRLIARDIEHFNKPVSSVYLSNAPEWIKQDIDGNKAVRTAALLAHPLMNPQGRLLMSTERTDCQEIRAARIKHDDIFTYHSLPLSDVRRELRQTRSIPAWTRGIQQRAGLKLNQRHLSAHK
jgi:hypothetical protein